MALMVVLENVPLPIILAASSVVFGLASLKNSFVSVFSSSMSRKSGDTASRLAILWNIAHTEIPALLACSNTRFIAISA